MGTDIDKIAELHGVVRNPEETTDSLRSRILESAGKSGFRVVAYEQHKDKHYIQELSAGSTLDDAIKICVEGQAKYGSAWVQQFDLYKGIWVNK
jgi:hypothetical protein